MNKAKGWLLLPLLVCLVLMQPSQLQASERLKVGVALSGGGAKGAAHVGVLRVLEQHQIPVDYIAGTSMGAYIATLYAAGYSLDEIEFKLNTLDFASGYSDRVPRGDLNYRTKQQRDRYPIELKTGFEDNKLKFAKGALEGQTMSSLLRRSIGSVPNVDDFDEMPIPLRTVATDLVDRSEVVLAHGDLVSAMQASMTVPGALAPIQRNGRLLVDGGLVNNLPIQVVRDMGADVVIAVDIGSPLRSTEELTSVFDVLDQLSGYLTNMSRDQQVALMQSQDVLVSPDVKGVGTGDFALMPDMIPRGEQAMLAKLDRIKPFSVSPAAYQEYRRDVERKHRKLFGQTMELVKIRIDNRSWVKDGVIREALKLETGAVPSNAEIDRAVARVYAISDFARVDAELVELAEGYELVVTARGKDWGPNLLDFGLSYEDNLNDSINWDVGIALTSNNVGPYDGQWRNAVKLGVDQSLLSEYYQPLDELRRYYAIASFEFNMHDWDAFSSDGTVRLAEAEQKRKTYRLGLGWNIGNSAQLQVAYLYEDGFFEEEISSNVNKAKSHYWQRGFDISFGYDRLDQAYFPTQGSGWKLRAQQIIGGSDPVNLQTGGIEMATDVDYWVYSGKWVGANHIGKHNFFAKLEAEIAEDDQRSLMHFVTAGGFFELSGFYQDALYGNHKAIAGLGYHYDLGISSATGNAPLSIGFSVEAGNVWLVKDDIDIDDLIYGGSVFIGADTGIGNVSLGYGYNDRHESSLYLVIGSSFQ